jgi:hypothetical protein
MRHAKRQLMLAIICQMNECLLHLAAIRRRPAPSLALIERAVGRAAENPASSQVLSS